VPLALSTPVKFIKRIGDRIAAGLAERGILTVEDLLYQLPFRYEDRLHPKPLSLYNPGDMASLIGEVRGTVLLRTRSGPIFEMTVGITPPAAPTISGAPFIPMASSSEWVGLHNANSSTRSPSPFAQEPLDPKMGFAPPILETVKCMWFHGTYLKDKFRPGQSIALYGKLEGSRSGTSLHAPPGSSRFKMIQPTFEILPDRNATGEDAEFTMLEMGRIVPIYESLGGKTPWGSKLTSRWHRRVLWTVFKDLVESNSQSPSPQTVILSEAQSAQPKDPPAGRQPHSAQPLSAKRSTSPSAQYPGTRSLPPSAQDRSLSPDAQSETLPTSLRERLSLPTRMDALRDLHFPPAGTSMTELMSARTPAHRRLIFEEFWYLELGLELKRRRLRERNGTMFVTNDSVREALKQVLPFKPTAAQKRVLGEIVTDMRSKQPMRRLLQGDVGSGKTIVAFQAALVAIENGYQVALMAPTEILATQHYLSARKLLGEKISPRTRRPYRVALLTGSLDDRAKREAQARIFRGEVDLAIGTHALVEAKVDFANLGLVIIDEQHRFGVQQRFQLSRKPSAGTATQTTINQPTKGGTPSKATAPSSESVGVNQTGTTTQSLSPATQNPFAQNRATQNPFAQNPATQNPSTQNPATQDPSTQNPATQDPSTQNPATQDPSTKNPDTQDTFAQDPATQDTVILSEARSAQPKDLPARSDQHARSPLSAAQSPSPDAQSDPDVLVMTATPIPRTLALTLYGDLEVSVIDELPPGRSPIVTRRVPEERSTEVWDFIRKQVAAGHQTYIVYPIIEGAHDDQPELDFALEPETSEPTTKTRKKAQRPKLRSATEMHEELQQGSLQGLKLGLLHGRMSADEKEITMARFKRNEIQVLVSTTVIEVGVDVPNATLMVIEHAERFGLAQMHQLRGRVGRGAAKSFCILLTGATVSPEAELRLDAMVRTQNGFELAEVDLQQRGPGEFFGTRQAGLPEFRVANLARDRDLLELAKLEAAHFVDHPDPTMPRPEIDAVWSRLKHQWQRRYGLVEA
jgi:RecG-like helicase